MLRETSGSIETAGESTPFVGGQKNVAGRLLLIAMIGVLLVVALLGFMRIYQKVSDGYGAFDFHPYWYFSHFVRAGVSPYIAYEKNLPLPEGVSYWDGSAVLATPEDTPNLGLTPASIAPILLFVTPFSYLHWNEAKFLWLYFTLALVIATPWLAVRLVPPQLAIPRLWLWVIALAFYATKATRESTAVGQVTSLVLFLMVVTLVLPDKYWLLAGLALGVALGKYSMALPLCIYLLLAKRFRVLIVAGVVQLGALIWVSALDNGAQSGSLWEKMVETLKVNWSMVAVHSTLPGIHIPFSLREFPTLATVLVVLVTVVTLVAVVLSRRRGWTFAHLLPVNSALLLWILLVVYHRNYDTGMVLFYWLLSLSVIAAWPLSTGQKIMVGVVLALSVAILLLPGDILLNYSSKKFTWLFKDLTERSFTVSIFMMLVVNLWLLPRTPRLSAPSSHSPSASVS